MYIYNIHMYIYNIHMYMICIWYVYDMYMICIYIYIYHYLYIFVCVHMYKIVSIYWYTEIHGHFVGGILLWISPLNYGHGRNIGHQLNPSLSEEIVEVSLDFGWLQISMYLNSTDPTDPRCSLFTHWPVSDPVGFIVQWWPGSPKSSPYSGSILEAVSIKYLP